MEIKINKKGTDKNPAKQRAAKTFELFKSVVDELFEEGVEISPRVLNERSNGKFHAQYYCQNDKAKSYWKTKKREQVEKKLIKVPTTRRYYSTEEQLEYAKNLVDTAITNGEDLCRARLQKIAEKQHHVRKGFFISNKEILEYIREKEKEIKQSKKSEIIFNKELSDIKIEYLISVIDFFNEKFPEEIITIDKIFKLVNEGSSSSDFSKDLIEKNKIIKKYIWEKNNTIESFRIATLIRETVLQMKKENIPVNMYSLLNRCKLSVSYLEEHKDIYIIVKEAFA